jgi:hypothetical protein
MQVQQRLTQIVLIGRCLATRCYLKIVFCFNNPYVNKNKIRKCIPCFKMPNSFSGKQNITVPILIKEFIFLGIQTKCRCLRLTKG